jgi:biopolymer transport protein ExbB/TolQ
VLECSRHAADRAAATLHLELGRGTTGLRAIACTAPLLGLLGTVVLFVNALRSYSIRNFAQCDCAGGVAETLVPLALSLNVAVFAAAAFRYLSDRIEVLDFQMRMATLDLVDILAVHR